jgi:nucleoside-diphosphate-sugar epimerase
MILLTGATGFLGSHILEELIEKQLEVVILTRNKSSLEKIKHLPKSSYKTFNADENSLESLYSIYPIKTIIHTAVSYGHNNDYVEIINTNITLPIQLIEIGLRNQLSSFINTDSYFNKDNLSYSHLIHYSTSKKSFDNWLKFFSQKIKIISLRLEHIYGPRDNREKFCNFVINSIAIQKIPQIDLTHGHQMRDFIYVKDAARAFISILNLIQRENFRYRKYDIGTGQATQIREFINLVKEISKSQTILNFGAIPYRNDEIMSSFADVTEIFNTGWKPTFSIGDGIIATIDNRRNLLKTI